MTDPKMIAIYRAFMKDKTDVQITTIRHERSKSTDKGGMAHFCAFLTKRYQVTKKNAWAIYKCDYHETWIGDLKND